MMVTPMQLVVAISLFVAAMGATTRPLDLTPNKSGDSTVCMAPNNKTGICVHESICNEEHTIMPGGVIEDSDFRTKKQCPLQTDWCCTSDVIPPPQISAAESDKCLAPETDVCPWCVLLYNVVDVKPTALRPFCLGVLIGSRVIITASTCLKAAQKRMLYAQIPNSASSRTNYTVIRRQFHPNYNSGSHEYDYGVLVIERDVMFKEGKPRGACLDFLAPFAGDCVGYGIDNRGNIVSTIMKVKKNSCRKNGSAVDAACGSNVDTKCIVAPGGPVLCQTNNPGLLVQGIARNICNNEDQVMLGGISHSQTWLEETLNSMNVSKDVYTLNPRS